MMSIGIFLGGFLVHLIFLASIFDIYFRTPIVTGINSHPNPVPGPAKRLVFIVADGLRADSFYSNAQRSTPFLRNKIESFASWGVSHTRVPTESRPGVVALAAGIYEDPSAVFKGWKENPVDFDSLFNQSRYTWAWGSPDIVHMFRQDHVETMSYSSDDEDFSGKDSSWKLDVWVFDHFKILFNKAKEDLHLNDLLHKDKLVFFLHLLGLDTAGHTIKPLSLKYQENLQVVDSGLKNLEEFIESFYSDMQTAYVFTADHGMTNWGSHGAGSKDETEVPMVAWGAGVRGASHADTRDPVSPENWYLSHLKRKDVQQADIVVLLASLIGCSIPVNSVGRLPRPFLDMPEEELAKLSFSNAMQLLGQANRKRELIQKGLSSFFFWPFSKLTPKDADIKVRLIQQFFSSKNFDAAAHLSEELSELSIHALHYYHNYYQSLLLTSVSLSFVGWIAWLLCQLSNQHHHNKSSLFLYPQRKSKYVNKVFVSFSFLVFLLIQVQGLDWQFNVYCLLPLVLWRSVFSSMDSWIHLLDSGRQIMKFGMIAVLLIIFTEIMIVAFFQRWILSLGVLVSSLWPLLDTQKTRLISPRLLSLWLLSCALVAVFPLFPVIGSESNLPLLVFSGLLWVAVIGIAMRFILEEQSWLTIMFALSPLICATCVVYYVSMSMEAEIGLPVSCQLLSWLLLLSSFIICVNASKNIPHRLIKLYSAIIPSYILLSVRHEGLFLLALCFHLSCWLALEATCENITTIQLNKIQFPSPTMKRDVKRMLSLEDFRRAALFVFYIFLSFFGTGNIASLNSFELIWVRCFLSVFSPFTMMFLILVKILIPFILVSSVFRGINITIKAPTSLMFLAVLIICDVMGLHFLHLVTNEGSWLDIGTSISHFVIVQVTVLALVLLYGLASVLTGASFPQC